MIRNYLKIAFRNIIKRKSFTFLNVLGLGAGIASCIILFIVVRYENSYDNFVSGKENIYRLTTVLHEGSGDRFTCGIPIPAVPALRADFPQATTASLMSSFGGQVTVLGADANTPSTKKFIEDDGVFFSDPEFFKILSPKWLQGTPDLLKDPNVTALSRSMAVKYFGDWKDAVGKYLLLDNVVTVKVAGILEDVPQNSDFRFKMVTSLITARNNATLYNYNDNWGSTSSNFQVYMSLPAGTDTKQIDRQLLQFSNKNYNNGNGRTDVTFLQPFVKMHFDKRFETFGDHVTSKSTLLTLSLIGVFIILMACINFINLSTAQAINRSKEVGIRKVLGSRRSSLFWQMMGETAFIVLIALLLAIVLAIICLPFIKHIASISETLTVFTAPTILFTLGAALLVTFLAGSYPALILSGFKPMLALKNKITSASIGGISLRRSLVVLQFAISQVLIIGTIVAIAQMNHVHKADLGFDKEAVLVLESNSDSVILARQAAMKLDLLALQGVQSASFSSDVPSSGNNWATNFAFDHKNDEDFPVFIKLADEDYFKTFGLKILAGRSYEKFDTMNEVVINETLLHALQLKEPQAAVGKELRMGGGQWKSIVGVVKDFKTNSLREDTKPLLLTTIHKYYRNTSIKMRGKDLVSIKASVQKVWDKYNPEYANRSSFMDENINEFYKQENQLALLYKIFAVIAILISCLGLYGLVSFMAVQRTKEVGVRKVLGASIADIVYLFSKEFTILIIVAFAVAAPLAWYIMKQWLGNFSYRISIGVSVFLIAILASVVIAWITVGYKSVQAAVANPVKSLRAE